MSEILKGKLGWKGERGYSAYEIAVQNGFEGTEQDWLATLGTSSHFDENYALYTITDTDIKQYNLPSTYVTGTFISAYLNGARLNQDEYSVDETNSKIIIEDGVSLSVDDKLEVVENFLATNNLPIVSTIDAQSTNDTAPGSKCVYDKFVDVANNISSISGDLSNLETVVNGLVNTMHPVGSVYLSVDNTNPSTLFGGTWEQIAQGRAIVGVGTGTDSNGTSKSFSAGNNNGEYSHKLTINEMPSHTHEITASNEYTPGGLYRHAWDADDSRSNVHTTGATGGSQYHNIVQPTFGLYIWKRTA